MNKILEAMAVHAYLNSPEAYLNSPEYDKAERDRHRKMDEDFVRKHIVGVVGTAAEGGFRDEIV